MNLLWVIWFLLTLSPQKCFSLSQQERSWTLPLVFQLLLNKQTIKLCYCFFPMHVLQALYISGQPYTYAHPELQVGDSEFKESYVLKETRVFRTKHVATYLSRPMHYSMTEKQMETRTDREQTMDNLYPCINLFMRAIRKCSSFI